MPESEIFCSSLEGYDIPTGENFVTYIKEQLLKPKVVVLVLTPAYFESKFCLSELGAAWIMSPSIFPILVPPLRHSDVKDVLLGTHIDWIENDIKYNELRDTLVKEIEFTPSSPTKWDIKRRSFLIAIKPILENVAGPTVVSAADLKATTDQLAEALKELEASEAEIRRLKERLAATEALKNKSEVAAVRDQYADEDVSGRLASLTDDIAAFRSVLKSRKVVMFVLSAHYGKPFEIDWFHDRDEFDEAARYGFMDLDDGGHVIWSKPQVKKFREKLRELDQYVAEHRKALHMSLGEDVPLDPGAQDFWEHHYKI